MHRNIRECSKFNQRRTERPLRDTVYLNYNILQTVEHSPTATPESIQTSLCTPLTCRLSGNAATDQFVGV
jgi:hypothetical protein